MPRPKPKRRKTSKRDHESAAHLETQRSVEARVKEEMMKEEERENEKEAVLLEGGRKRKPQLMAVKQSMLISDRPER